MLKTLAPIDGSSDAPCATGRKPLDIPFKVQPPLHGSAPHAAPRARSSHSASWDRQDEASRRMSQGRIGQEWLPAGGAAASPVSTVLLRRRMSADVAAQGVDAS